VLTEIYMKNWECHDDTKISLRERLTVFVGPNGSGKSSTFRAIEYLHQATRSPEWPLSVFSKKKMALGVFGEKDGHSFERYVIGDSKEFGGGPNRSKRGWWFRDVESHISHQQRPDDIPVLIQKWSNAHWRRLVDCMVEVFPDTIRNMRVEPGDGIGHEPYVLICLGHRTVPLSKAGRGIRAAMALLADLHRPEPLSSLILVENIGEGIHPAAQQRLMNKIWYLLLEQSDLADVQIVATSNSPYAIDDLPIGLVQVFAADPIDGKVYVKGLWEHPDLPKLDGVLSLGELWSSVGEVNWVVPQGEDPLRKGAILGPGSKS